MELAAHLLSAMKVCRLNPIPYCRLKNINIYIVDEDHSEYSRLLLNKITASGYFKLSGFGNSFNQSLVQVEKDKADVVLEIPAYFEKPTARMAIVPDWVIKVADQP